MFSEGKTFVGRDWRTVSSGRDDIWATWKRQI